MLNKFKWGQIGQLGMDIKGITIHNTSNYQLNAMGLKSWLESSRTSQGCHFIVDENEIVEILPLSYHAWHTGRGYDFGNMNTIAIEICSYHDKEKYLKAEKRAVALIKELMKKYHLSKDDIFFHSDFCQVNCPANILGIYKDKKRFIETYWKGEKV